MAAAVLAEKRPRGALSDRREEEPASEGPKLGVEIETSSSSVHPAEKRPRGALSDSRKSDEPESEEPASNKQKLGV